MDEKEIESRIATHANWQLNNGHLRRRVSTKDFSEALSLANTIGAIADTTNHHPTLQVAWGSLDIETWSHDVGGITERDFALIAQIDAALDQ